MFAHLILQALAPIERAQVASSILKSKPTYVAVGDIKTLPYADELGL